MYRATTSEHLSTASAQRCQLQDCNCSKFCPVLGYWGVIYSYNIPDHVTTATFDTTQICYKCSLLCTSPSQAGFIALSVVVVVVCLFVFVSLWSKNVLDTSSPLHHN